MLLLYDLCVSWANQLKRHNRRGGGTPAGATPGGENGQQQRELIAAPSVDELWEVSWQPSAPGTHPTSFPIVARPIAGGVESKTPTASKQAYRSVGFLSLQRLSIWLWTKARRFIFRNLKLLTQYSFRNYHKKRQTWLAFLVPKESHEWKQSDTIKNNVNLKDKATYLNETLLIW